MDLSILAGTAGVVVAIIAVAFAIATIAMPFLVWSIHSSIGELRGVIGRVESDLSDIRLALDTVETIVYDSAGATLSDAGRADLHRLYQLRSRSAPADPLAEPGAPRPAAPPPAE